jgi:GNAT superfamily N-acetyltransferase
MEHITCRKSCDWDTLQLLDKEIFKDEAESRICRTTLWWLLELGGQPVGFAGLDDISEGKFRGGMLVKAGLLPIARGNGLQKRLIQIRDRAARKQGLTVNITYVAEWNYASANNLIECGYKLYTPQWKYGLADALYFRKYL